CAARAAATTASSCSIFSLLSLRLVRLPCPELFSGHPPANTPPARCRPVPSTGRVLGDLKVPAARLAHDQGRQIVAACHERKSPRRDGPCRSVLLERALRETRSHIRGHGDRELRVAPGLETGLARRYR